MQLEVFQPLSLSGKHFLVTGASSGIGRATAILFSRLGAKLTLTDLDSVGLELTASQLSPSEHKRIEFDLTRIEAIPELIRVVVAGQGPLYGLVHSAGIQMVMPARLLNVDHWRQLFAVNTEAGLALATTLHSRRISAGGGSVIFISSIMGLVGSPGAVAYSMSKAALHGITRSLALEFASKLIRVNCIAPGFVHTPLFDRTERLWDDAQRHSVLADHPLGIGEPEDIANAAAFLAADTGRWITGTVLVVDGGYLAK